MATKLGGAAVAVNRVAAVLTWCAGSYLGEVSLSYMDRAAVKVMQQLAAAEGGPVHVPDGAGSAGAGAAAGGGAGAAGAGAGGGVKAERVVKRVIDLTDSAGAAKKDFIEVADLTGDGGGGVTWARVPKKVKAEAAVVLEE